MNKPFTTIVSGLPRSGTSMMMQILAAGGLNTLTDHLRPPDEDNPQGYWEWQPILHLANNPGILHQAIGKAVKVIHLLLPSLPADIEHRVIFMRRDMTEILNSQQTMLQRKNPTYPTADPTQLARTFATQIDRVLNDLHTSSNIRVLEIQFAEILTNPRPHLESIAHFLDSQLNLEAMQTAILQNLYRNRTPPPINLRYP